MVFILSRNKTPLAPTRRAKARILLKEGKTVVHKVYPFTIRLKENKELSKNFEITTGKGWETYANRKELNLPKQHYYDAVLEIEDE